MLCLLLNAGLVFGQEGWKLSVVKDEISIYTRPVVNSKIKAIKVECSLPVRQAQLVAAILDIDNSGQWVYHSKRASIIKRVSPAELYYYAEVAVPWPAENREYVAHIMVNQNTKTKVITIDAPCVTGMVAGKINVVRITHSIGKWVIGAYQNNAIKVSYELEVDPAGSVPAWLVNAFATQGPMETFERLKRYLQKKEYRDVKLDYLQD
ncbi:START domain-containing protein [Mucilaginibacter gracilis]|uniref:START domain-containing protein n=1 Tax=Mucilaginibacter gracilis TaxID=423350 RepID=A0A495J9L0_9SPHI|nr:START domain-containing protein [Mucilaginibacter gracilis]